MICNAHFRSEYFTTHEHQRLIISNQVEPIDYRDTDTSYNLNFNPEKSVRVYNSNDYEALKVAVASKVDAGFHNPSPVEDLSEIQIDLATEEEMITIRIPSPTAPVPVEENVPEKAELLGEIVQEERIIEMQNEIDRLRSMLRKVETQLSEIKSKTIASPDKQLPEFNAKVDFNSFLENIAASHPIRKTMIELQLRPDNSRAPYTEDQWRLAMKWHNWSAVCYEKFRQSGLQLPHSRSLKKRYDILPGFIEQQFEDLKILLNGYPSEARCSIIKFDEMVIKEFEEYSVKHDVIEGFEDLGPLGRTQKRANHVFVFTLNGLHPQYRWRIIGGFFFARNNVNGKDIVSLLHIMLDKSEKAGADVRMTVCDQGSPNMKCYKLLKVTTEKPAFIHNGKKIIAIHDFLHEMKNFVTALRKYGVIYMKGKKLYFSDMKRVWHEDQKCSLSCNLSHIKEVHMFPNSFQKMSVRRALQMVGGRMSKAMHEAHAKNLVKSDTLKESADCILEINRLTDAANSFRMYDSNPVKCALSREHPQPIQVLEDFLTWASTLKVFDAKSKKMKSLPCFIGLEMTIRGILELYKEVIFPLCTTLCSLYSIETLFSKVRGRGGFNPNPTPRMVRLILRHMLAIRHDVACSTRGNVSVEQEDFRQAISEAEKEAFKEQLEKSDESEVAAFRAVTFLEEGHFVEDATVTEQANYDEESGSEIDIDGDDDSDDDKDDDRAHDEANDAVSDCFSVANSDTEQFANKVKELLNSTEADVPFQAYSGAYDGSSLTYFAGYAAHATTKKWQCSRCYDVLLKPPEASKDQNDTYIESRKYESKTNYKVTLFKKPSEKFREIVTANLLSFERWVIVKRHQYGILQTLLDNAVLDTGILDPEWFSESDSCHEHRLFAVKALFKDKIHRVCSIDNSNANSEKKSKLQTNVAIKQARAAKRKANAEVGHKPLRKLRNLIHE